MSMPDLLYSSYFHGSMPIIEHISPSSPVSMHEDWYDFADAQHFWMQWRFEAVKKHLHLMPDTTSKVLEIGCGHGVMREQMESLGYVVDACDLNLHALELIKGGQGRVMLYNIYDKHPDLAGKYDMIMLMDMVEHIEDDVDFLKTAAAYLRPGGTVVLSVPASMLLFSKYDVEVGHIRRYTRKTMHELMTNAGFEPTKISYWAGSLVPVALARKAMMAFTKDKVIEKGLQPPNKLVDAVLRTMKNLETALPFHPIFGASIVAVGQLNP